MLNLSISQINVNNTKSTVPVSERILYSDNHIIAVNKLPSEIVQGDKTGDVPLSEIVKSYVKEKFNKPGNVYLGVIHRIDRPVSGAILFARTDKALSRMNKLIHDRKIKKMYYAIVRNQPPAESGRLENFLWKNEEKNKSFVVKETSTGAQKAELSYTLIGKSDSFYLLEVELHTGRHHQIRAQLAAIGCPIKGDLKYGSPRSNTDGSICLHARSIEFEHPVTHENIKIEAPLPKSDVWEFFK